jgi:uncharacterized NAD-dependent epimerase/dehydratase family protein
MTQRSGGDTRERVDEARRPGQRYEQVRPATKTLPTAFTRMIPTSDVDRLSVRTTNR